LWIGLAVDAIDPHAHHAIQLCVGFNGPVEFRVNPREPWTAYPGGALVRPGASHEFRAPGQRVANILFEPETALGRALLERFGGGSIVPLHAHARELAAAFDRGADDNELVDESMALLSRLADTDRPQKPTDTRILKVIDWIARHIDEPLALGEVAAVAGLSESRFRHLFVAETGIAFRPYVLWTRLNRALEMGFGGTSWTEAAHATNFADSAHLTRTCRRMYGLFPTSLRIDRTVQDTRQIA
ncbi:MAG: AraC family transcriptional regulator, partial [Hyphomicrobiales bacterium]